MRVRELASSHKKQALIHRLPGAHGRAVSVLVSVSTSILILIINNNNIASDRDWELVVLCGCTILHAVVKSGSEVINSVKRYQCPVGTIIY